MQIFKLNILYVEPFYSGSHKQWIDAYKKYSNHDIHILDLPGKKWKWRMHGGAITLAEKFNNLNKKFDLIICSDMLNLPVFKSLCNKNLLPDKIILYFHENQLSYPWSPLDKDVKLKRDLHYHYINYTSSLVSDYNFFNSSYHLQSYIEAVKKYLNKMPDFRNRNTVNEILDKSDVLSIGCDLVEFKKIDKKVDSPIILWNHRWEYDKNPDLFFKILIELYNDNVEFSLIVLGEKNKEYPEIFDQAIKKLKDRIIHFGYCDSYSEYMKYLRLSNILPVTSIQDFFGISIVEAVSCGNIPILPNRLSYPEILDFNKNENLFYESDKDLKNKLVYIINNISNLTTEIKDLSNYVYNNYAWDIISKKYDDRFESIVVS